MRWGFKLSLTGARSCKAYYPVTDKSTLLSASVDNHSFGKTGFSLSLPPQLVTYDGWWIQQKRGNFEVRIKIVHILLPLDFYIWLCYPSPHKREGKKKWSSLKMLLLVYNSVQLINRNRAEVNIKPLRTWSCSDKSKLLIPPGNSKGNQ